LHHLGMMTEGIRLPLTVLEEKNRDIVIKAMVHAGVLEA